MLKCTQMTHTHIHGHVLMHSLCTPHTIARYAQDRTSMHNLVKGRARDFFSHLSTCVCVCPSSYTDQQIRQVVREALLGLAKNLWSPPSFSPSFIKRSHRSADRHRSEKEFRGSLFITDSMFFKNSYTQKKNSQS